MYCIDLYPAENTLEHFFMLDHLTYKTVTTNMSYSIFKCLKTVRNVYENEAKMSFLQADFIDRGVINLARTGTCKVVRRMKRLKLCAFFFKKKSN